MDDPKHPNPDLELPPPPEEKLIPAHAESGEANPGVNPAGNAGNSKWRLVTMGIIAVIILEAISIYFLRTDNDIKFLQSFLGIPSEAPAPTIAPTLAPSPTSLPTPTQAPLSCKPRPACLDAEPRCMIPETDDMCPKVEPTPLEASETYCTMDAMKCPDGTYVGRTGPKCEFVCPKE